MIAPGATRPLDAAQARAIAEAFLPQASRGSRWNYHYTRAKLASDPLYPGIADALRGTRAPLLDLGCGLGLLAHTLHAAGIDLPYRGVDIDERKIVEARRAATRAGLINATFDTIDLANGLPAHAGSVAILDVLQYVDDAAQSAILDAAIAMLVPGARLVIRTGLEDGGQRAWLTRAADVFGKCAGWMHSRPRRYPRGDDLLARLDDAHLVHEMTPLYGNTPFNNWRIVAERRA